VIVSASHLTCFVTEAFEQFGVPSAEAITVANSLVEAELEGQSSHGVVRVPFLLEQLDRGYINPRPKPNLLCERGATGLLDGDNGLGPVVGTRALEIAIAKSRKYGIGIVAVRRSNHLGALAFYVRRAATEGMLALATSNTPPAMAPPGGRTAVLGTNPIAAAFPSSDHPIVVDMATTQAARGRILNAAATGQGIPETWAVDEDGQPTSDPHRALAGTLSPLGGAKGFALALIVEVLAGVLSGSAVGPEVVGTFKASSRPSDIGHCFLAIDPTSFGLGFEQRMHKLGETIRGVAVTDPTKPVRLPGDRRRRERQEHLRLGIDVPATVLDQLAAMSGRSIG
jgi:LDH2 family malate/lactate/ureidoglycolate dehydrogenase